MISRTYQDVAEFFNGNWQIYKKCVQQNKLYHNELFQALNRFLHQNICGHAFTFVDAGCGDAISIAPVLLDNSIKKYIGIDVAEVVLDMAPANLVQVTCEKEFIAEDMCLAIKRMASPVEIIFSSYSLHHLSLQDKCNFIQECKNNLTQNGYLLIIDGVLENKQTRNEWLDDYETRYKKIYPELSSEQLEHCMKHHRLSDYPESIATFESISHSCGYKNFQVFYKIGSLVFMVFGN